MRRVRAGVVIGRTSDGDALRFWTSNRRGNLLDDPMLQRRIGGIEHVWGMTPWGIAPWGERREYAGYGFSPYGRGPYGAEPKIAYVVGHEYEEGVFEVGLSMIDRYGNATTEPPSSQKIYVNDVPTSIKNNILHFANGIARLEFETVDELNVNSDFSYEFSEEFR